MRTLGYACTRIAAYLCNGCGPHGNTDDDDSCCYPLADWDVVSSPATCDSCGDYIPVAWDSEAVEYVREAAARGPIPEEWQAELEWHS
jgi:hypothetical protein